MTDLSQFAVDGSAAIVTGASRGIGRAIAERFAADGVDVAICSREQADLDAVAEAVGESDRPGECLPVECDITDREAVEALVEAAVDEFGGLDVLVNNAGGSFMANFEDISPGGWARIVEINLTGAYHCTHAAADALRDGGGHVLNVSSVAGRQGAPYMSHYAAAKAGLEALTASLAYEWADDGVRVNCVAPGYVATPGLRSQMGIAPDDVDRESVDRTVGTPAEIADLAQFLVSPAASFVTGETVRAAGVPQIAETPET